MEHNKFDEMLWSEYTAVSYTHLDVYKRQTEDQGDGFSLS